MNNKSKAKCGVYGCIIPARIEHVHPRKSPVLRDPVLPLNDAERKELDHHRQLSRDITYRQIEAIQNGASKTDPKNIDNAPGKTISPEIEPQPPIDKNMRLTFSRMTSKISVWILVISGGFMVVGLLAENVVKYLRWL